MMKAEQMVQNSAQAQQPQIVYVAQPGKSGGITNALLVGLIVALGVVGLKDRVSITPPATSNTAPITFATVGAPSISFRPQPTGVAMAQAPAAVAPAQVDVAPVAPVVAQPLPTAQVVVAAVPDNVVVVPQANKPLRYATGSDMRPTALPTMVIPTPLTEGKDWTLSADGLCVLAPRGGKTYQACQSRPYSADEAKSIGDYLHTGLVPGVEVK